MMMLAIDDGSSLPSPAIILFASTVSSMLAWWLYRRSTKQEDSAMLLANEKPIEGLRELLEAPEKPSYSSYEKVTKQQLQHTKDSNERAHKNIKLGMVIFLTLAIVCACFIIIFTSKDQEQIKWSQSTIALILGYWLKSIS